MANFIPQTDPDFLTWMTTFQAYAAANTEVVGLQAADVADMLAQKNAFATALAAHHAAHETAQAAFAAKETARDEAEDCFRRMVRSVNAAQISAEQRAALGLPPRDETRSRIPVPTSRPVLLIGTEKGQEHRVNFADEGTPTRKAKPAGVAAVEIWATLPSDASGPPADDADYRLLGTDSATPYLAVYEAGDVAKKVWYRARWINTQQQHGPWSTSVLAVVTG